MPGRPKSGPPYPEVPEVYVVATNPWGMNKNPSQRRQADFNRVAAWAQLVLRESGVGGGRTPPIECIYGMGTREEIIIQFPPGTDIIPLLGEHRWANIAKKWDGNPADPRSTSVFIYNWRKQGDPTNHNWSENYPDDPNLVVPAKSPYPAPSWTQPPPSLTNFVHSIPRAPDSLPVPNNQDQAQQPTPSTKIPPKAACAASVQEQRNTTEPEHHDEGSGTLQDSASGSLFRPYEPPSHHPSHAQFPISQRVQHDEVPAPAPAQQPEPKFVTKLDPYELEDDAFRALKSEDTDSDMKPLLPLASPEETKVKVEETKFKVEVIESKPSVASASGSQHTRDPRRRPEVPQTFGIQVYQHPHQPTAEFSDEVNAFLAGIAAASGTTNVPPSDTQSTPLVSVKREYEDDVEVAFSGKRIKIEEP